MIKLYRDTLKYLNNEELQSIIKSSKYDEKTKKRAGEILHERGVYG